LRIKEISKVIMNRCRMKMSVLPFLLMVTVYCVFATGSYSATFPVSITVNADNAYPRYEEVANITAIPLPANKETFIYPPVATPMVSTSPPLAEPVSIGSLAQGGSSLTVQLDIAQFEGPVDIYGAFNVSTSPQLIMSLKPDLTSQTLTVQEIRLALTAGQAPAGLMPLMSNVTTAVNVVLFSGLPVSRLAPGTYTIFLLVTPAGNLGTYYLWETSFIVSNLQGSMNSDVLTYHNDNLRTGQNLNETILTPGNVNVNSFGKLFVIPVDGKVDAQPLYVSNVSILGKGGNYNLLIVATEHDSVYAFDADAGALIWQVSMLQPGEMTSDDRGCEHVSPEIGVTATPVIDRNAGPHGTVYVVAMSKDQTGQYFQRLHALDLTTGVEEFGGPKDIKATFPGTGDNSSGIVSFVSFDPGQYDERPGLLLANGVVYTAWSSHCDFRPYTGWLISYDQNSLAQVSVLNLTANGNRGSFWNSGAAPAADANGNIFALLANGTFDTALDHMGFPASGDFGNSFLKISTMNNHLAVADYFAPFNVVAENAADQDLGSGGALVLPDLIDAAGQTRRLAVGAGKDRHIYVVDRDNMGKFKSSNNDNVYQDISGALGGPEFGMPAYFNGTIYYGAVGDFLKAFPISNNAMLWLANSSRTTNVFSYPGATPSISANGNSNGIIWAAENGDPAVLHAYDAIDLTHELYNSNLAPGGRDHFGTGNKFITPTIADGKVYVGTTNGVGVFGLLGK
jgi:hypothetical protein